MWRKTIVSLLLIFGVLGAAAAFTTWLFANRIAPHEVERGRRALLVGAMVVEAKDTLEILHGYGTARADLEATLTAEVSAGVLELVQHLKVGDKVEHGQVLVRLDDRQYRQELNEALSMIQVREAELNQLGVERSNMSSLLEIAVADLDLNREELDRVKSLYDSAHAPRTEFDDARLKYQASLRIMQTLENELALIEPRRLSLQAQKSAAEARVEGAQLNIERCQITAPFAGQVATLNVDIGDKVRIGGEVLRLVNLDLIEVPLELPISSRPRTALGARAKLQVESMPELSWTGAIARIAPIADTRSRTFQAYVEVDNRNQVFPLQPGYFVKAEVDGPVIENAMLVPRTAIADGLVYVLNSNSARSRTVTVDRYLGDDAVVSGDLRPGDRVITTNLDRLYDGAAVRLENESLTADVDEAADDVDGSVPKTADVEPQSNGTPSRTAARTAPAEDAS